MVIMNILGIDFEDWFHPQLVQKYLDDKKKKPIVINGIEKILELLRVNDAYATFFVVGELLEHDHSILDKIVENGHEVGFHTMHHDRLDTSITKENFSKEIIRFAELTNNRSKGFRAPTFSLNHKSSWAVDVLAMHNYVYDSSVVPLKTTMYGLPNAEIKPYKISSSSLERNDANGKLLEFPLAIGRFMGKKMPIAGGFYLRFLPISTIKNAIQEYEKQNLPATFYIHSWELTPQYMPRIKMSFKDSFITYHNIEKAFSKMSQLLKSFTFTSFERYISQNKLDI
jgi:polysaccharide deacetylase family protein (PEP-CTERM system associated)